MDSPDKADAAPARAARKPWSAPRVIIGDRWLSAEKSNAGLGYEYHETGGGVGGGTTPLS